MDNLNEYLHQLVSSSANSLHLEPNRKPYLATESGNTDVVGPPLQGSQINMLIFTLIPNDVKQQLPGNSEVEFVHPHNLGDFTFKVQKSPAGFNVTVSPNTPPAQTAPGQVEPETPTAVEPTFAELEFNSLAPSQDLDDDETASAFRDDIPEIDLDGFEFESGYEIPDEADEEPAEDTAAPAFTYPTIEPEPTPQFRSAQPETERPEEPEAFSSSTTPVIETAVPEAFVDPEPTVSFEQPEAPAVSPPDVTFRQPVVPAPEPVNEQYSTLAASVSTDARAKMDQLFRKMAANGASDLHMSVSVPPMIRKDGKMVPLESGQGALTPDSIRELLSSIMPPKNLEEFARRSDTDFAYEIPDLARFRANIFMDRKGMGGVFRIIPSDMMTAEDLGLSKHILDLCNLSKGLVVVTGPTGSGKSTTLCAMINYINERREDHIITIEDPIEFTHENKKCLVNQREVHNHTDSFKDALRAALREDPDILLVGEMRDLETISIAIETAETGHLVFGTLHTTTAASTVDRIIDQFPADRQQQIRVMLSESLRGVIAQTLLPKKGGGRVAALEVLIVTPAISNLIREGKTFQIPSSMQTGKNLGMSMLNDSLMDLVKQGLVEPRDAYIKAVDKTGFELLLQRSGMQL